VLVKWCATGTVYYRTGTSTHALICCITFTHTLSHHPTLIDLLREPPPPLSSYHLSIRPNQINHQARPFYTFSRESPFSFVKGKEKKRINKIGWCVEGKGGESGVQDFAVWKREGYLTCSSLVLVVWCVRAVAIL